MASEKKLLPYDPCEIDAIEGWLDEQARDGWRLESIDGAYFYFERPADASLTRYRIDILPKGIRDLDERRATFDDLGWEYIDTLSRRFDVYAAARPDAVEINTDEELLRQTVKSYYLRRTIKGHVIVLLVLLLLVLLRLALPGEPAKFYAYLLSSRGHILWLVPLYVIAIIIGTILDTRVYKGVTSRILLHREFHTPQRATGRKVLRYGIYFLLLAATIINVTQDNLSRERHRLPFPDEAYPFPTLADISPEEGANRDYVLREQRYPLSDFGWLSITISQEEADAAETIAWSYILEYHDTKWRWLAKGYAREVAKQQPDAETVPVEGYKTAYYWQDDGEEHLLLWDGEKRVVEVTYAGEASLRHSLPCFAIP